MRGRLLPLIVALTAFATGAMTSAQTACDDTAVTVTAPTPDIAAQICRAATRASALLSHCDLIFEAPVAITIVDDLVTLPPHCVAQYDCNIREIQMLGPAQLTQHVPQDSRFARLPVSSYLDSLVAHELTRVALNGTAASATVMPPIAHEYIAYAMQIRALHEPDRAAFLADATDGAALSLVDVNPIILAMAPDLFAQRAAMHFSQPGHGCQIVRDLRNGAVRLPEVVQ